MMSPEQNELITRIGPGTKCGALMRHYWHPVALADELPQERPAKAVRVLGQDFVLFRDERGRHGLLDRDCPHRGADLAYGRLEDGGLRCLFHGWLFDVDGKCLETPAEPEGSVLCQRVRQRSYPVMVKNGIIFAYLGEGRGARLSRFRLLPGARHARLRLQGPDRVQLAAGARGRHRSRARLLPAPLLRGRGHGRRLRQAVPLRLVRFRHPDDAAAARVHAAQARRRGDGLRAPPVRAAHAERAAHPCARDQPRLPLRLRDPDERGDDHHPMARADRRHVLLLVRDLHQLRRAGRSCRDARAAAEALPASRLSPAPRPAQ